MKKFQLAVLTVTISLFVSFVAMEYILLGLGHRPWTNSPLRENEPTMNESDAVLGWRNKPGSYVVPAYATGQEPIRVRILANGSRTTRNGALEPMNEHRDMLMLVGGSFTLGAAVSDEENFAWKLQHSFPDIDVVNYGTGGYGTYQSLLLLEDKLTETPVPRVVVYGFIENHEDRNVASADWLENLSHFSHRGHVSVPYATLEDGTLQRHSPVHYPAWFLHERLAAVASAERTFARIAARQRTAQRGSVTRALISEMNRLARSRNIGFVVVLLNFRPGTRLNYVEFFQNQAIAYANCDVPLTMDRVVPGEWVHPTGEVHSYYAECVAAAVKEMLSQTGSGVASLSSGHLVVATDVQNRV